PATDAGRPALAELPHLKRGGPRQPKSREKAQVDPPPQGRGSPRPGGPPGGPPPAGKRRQPGSRSRQGGGRGRSGASGTPRPLADATPPPVRLLPEKAGDRRRTRGAANRPRPAVAGRAAGLLPLAQRAER